MLHHRFVHEYGYRVELDDTQNPRFYDPHGCEVLGVPHRSAPARLGLPTIIDLNAGLEIEPTTNDCLWDGDWIRYGDVIDALVRADGLN